MRSHAAFAALLFIAAILGTLPYLVAPSQAGQQVLPSAPYAYSNNISSTLYNLSLFIILIVIATIFIYLLFHFKKLFKLFIAFAWAMIVWGVAWAYAIKYYYSGLLPDWGAEALFYSPIVSIPLVLYALFKGRSDWMVALLSSLAGTMMVWILPPLTVLALLAALPIYDAVMVYWGLLGRLIRKAKAEAPPTPPGERPKEVPLLGLMAHVGDVSVGSGDFFAYTMALTYIGVKYALYGALVDLSLVLLGLILIYIGFLLTVKLLLKRYGYAPALPLPLAMLMPLILL